MSFINLTNPNIRYKNDQSIDFYHQINCLILLPGNLKTSKTIFSIFTSIRMTGAYVTTRIRMIIITKIRY